MMTSNDTLEDYNYNSHCWNKDGTFHIVCMVIIGASITVAFVTTICIVQIVKMCGKLREDHRADKLKLQEYKLQIEPQNVKEDPDDCITTVETSFITTHDDNI
jgi:ammonia channel protein AmtB